MAAVVTVVFAVAVTVWSVWSTAVAFVGGTVPVFGWELAGSVNMGLLWLFVVTPIAETVAFWLAALVAIPLEVLFGKRGDE